MKRILTATALIIPLVMMMGLAGCLEDREVEVVINQDICEPFPENHESENYTTPKEIAIGANLDEMLSQHDYTRDDITSAHLMGGSYEITEFAHDHDWTIEGYIIVERLDIAAGPVTLIEYDNISLETELGIENSVSLHPDGVALVNAAMADWITGANPILRLTVVSEEGVDPSPSPSDPLVFEWEACLDIQVISTIDAEVFTFIGG